MLLDPSPLHFQGRYLFRGTKDREVSVIPYALYRFLYSSEIPRKWKRYRVSLDSGRDSSPFKQGRL